MEIKETGFTSMLRKLLVINEGYRRLQEIASNPGKYGKEQSAMAHAQLKTIPDDLITAFNLFATLKMKPQGMAIVDGVVNKLDGQLNLSSTLFENGGMQQGTGSVEYSIYMLLDAFVQDQLMPQYPSILGLDIPISSVPKDAAVIVIPQLGTTAIVFGDYAEAEKCFWENMAFCARLGVAKDEESFMQRGPTTDNI